MASSICAVALGLALLAGPGSPRKTRTDCSLHQEQADLTGAAYNASPPPAQAPAETTRCASMAFCGAATAAQQCG